MTHDKQTATPRPKAQRARDMSDKQFLAALRRHGMRMEGVLGYVELGIEGQHVSCSILNAGHNHRRQLAYLLAQRDKYEREGAAKTVLAYEGEEHELRKP